MQFRFVAYSRQEGIVRGRTEARTDAEARGNVASLGLRPLRLRRAARFRGLEERFPSLFRVRARELIRFCRHLASMLMSGGNLLRTLEMLQRQSRDRVMSRTLEAIRRSLDDGGSLSSALAEHPTVFDTLFVSVVEVGEHTGRIGPGLEHLADILEQGMEARKKAMRTMMYPMAIVVLGLVTLGVLMVVALPPMLKVFERMGADVPLVTRIPLTVLRTGSERWLEIVGGMAALGALAIGLRSIPRVRAWADAAMARVPILGETIVSGEIARFARTIAMLLDAGVPLVTALRLAITGCKNRALRAAFTEAEESLLTGRGLAAALRACPVLPSMFVELVVIGEESNTLQRSMNDAATAYQRQLEERMNSLLGMLEPASTLAVGAIVGLIAFSMFMPTCSGLNVFK
jgi:type IV pilus assembly protein PilC